MGIFGRRPRLIREYSTDVRALTAAASLLGDDTDESKATEAWLKRQESWTQRAWMFYSQIPEVRAAARYFGDGIARCGLFAGIRADPYSDPVPLVPEGDTELGYTAAEAQLAIETLARLRNPQGGLSEILRRLAMQLFVAGEGLLFGREDDVLGERWDIYSTREMQLRDGNYELRAPSAGGEVSTVVKATWPKDDVVAVRIWRQHPEWSEWADSPMRAAEMILDELLVLTKAIKAVALSRVAGPGMLFLPSSMRRQVGQAVQATAGGGQAQAHDDVVADMIKATGAAISDPGSAASQVPLTVWVPDSVYEQIGSDKLIRWSRELDEVMEKQRQSLLDRFAVTADIPTAELKDKSGINHWGMWAIPEDAFRTYFEPAAVLIATGLTATFFAPALREAGAGALAERLVIWYDPSGLVSPPDQGADYIKLYDRGEVSGEALRRAHGVSEDEMPEDDEIEKRIGWGWGQPGSGAASGEAQAGGETPGPREVPGAPAAIALPAARPQALTAALEASPAEAEPLEGLAETLGAMDASLSRDIFTSAEAAFRRALERANARIKSLAQPDKKLALDLADLAASDLAVAPALGPRVVDRLANGARFAEQGEEGAALLFAGAFAPLGAEWSRRTRRVAEETIRLAAARGDLSESEAQVLLDQLAEDTHAGWQLLLAALSAVAVEKLYRPVPDDGPGETVDQLLPPALVRAALARAGGGGAHAVSMLTGDTVTAVYRQASIEFRGWEWQYGDPSARITPFEPHMHLGGQRLTGPDDPKLVHMASFPPGGRYWPGEHRGCLCNVVRVAAVKVKPSTIVADREVA